MNPSHRRAGWRHSKDGRRYNIYVDTYAERIPGGWWARDGKEIALRAKGRTFPTWGDVHRARFGYIPGRFGQTVLGVDMAKPGGDRTAIVTGRRHGKRAEFSLYIDGHKVPGVTGIQVGEATWKGEPLPRHTDSSVFKKARQLGRSSLAAEFIDQLIDYNFGAVLPPIVLPTKPSSDDPIGEILRNSPHPFQGVDYAPKVLLNDAKPVRFTIEQFRKDVLKVYGDGLHADINAPSPLLQILNVQEPSEGEGEP